MNPVIFRMAIRNLREHKRKSLTVGVIVAAASFIFILGSSFLETAEAGMRTSYRNRFTGDLYVTAATPRKLSAFGWEDQGMMNQALPLLPRHADIKAFAAKLPGVEALASRSVSFVRVAKEGSDSRGATLLMGVDAQEYALAFPEAFPDPEAASRLESEQGILVSSFLAEGMGESAGLGERLLLSSLGMNSSIREGKVIGSLPEDAGNPILSMVSYVPVETLRALLGHYAGSGSLPAPRAGAAAVSAGGQAAVTAAGQATGQALDEESLFGGGILSESSGSGVDLESLISGIGADGASDLDPDAYQYLVIQAKTEADIPGLRAALSEFFLAEGIDAEVHDWLEGAGMIASSVLTVKNIFYGICVVVAAVAVLIIMNALVISVTERTGEIGTMRAIGASRKFVTRLIMTETLVLSAAAGVIGITAGALTVRALGAAGLRSSNFMLRILFGGEILRPELGVLSILAALASVLAVGVMASWYPTAVALRVNPSTAMIRE